MDPQFIAHLEQIKAHGEGIAQHAQALIEMQVTIEPAKHGQPIEGITDADGQQVNAGDKVNVTGSSRYGDFEGVVVNRALGIPGRGNPRVHVPHPEDPQYTTSVARITRTGEACTEKEYADLTSESVSAS
jgi:hypothetical protein